jgi:hypothetical protein
MADEFAFTYTKVTIEEAKEVADGQPEEKKTFTHMRKDSNPAPVKLLDTTATWILSIPAEFRPMALAKKYPRIANVLAKAWPYPVVFEDRLKEFTLDDRSPRQGFPLDVAMDLANLKTYFRRVDTRFKDDVWNEFDM